MKKLALNQLFAFLDVGGGGVSRSALSASLNRAGRSVSLSVDLDETFFLVFLCTISLSAPRGQFLMLFYQPVKLSGEVIPSNALPVGQSLARNLFNGDFHSFAVSNVAIVPTKFKLGGVAGQVLFADVMKRANDAALNQTK